MNSMLINPIWTALTTGTANFSTGNELCQLLNPEMGFFAGMPNYRPENLKELSTQLAPGSHVILFTDGPISLDSGWEVLIDRALLQVVCETSYLPIQEDAEVVTLTESDIPAMLSLTDLTKPGPFLSRTFDFGGYLGVKKAGELISMAGYRLRPGLYTEISAVCTHPDFLGLGLSQKVMRQLLKNIQAEGQIPFLHLYPENLPALKLYEKLGFKKSNLLRVYRLVRNA